MRALETSEIEGENRISVLPTLVNFFSKLPFHYIVPNIISQSSLKLSKLQFCLYLRSQSLDFSYNFDFGKIQRVNILNLTNVESSKLDIHEFQTFKTVAI